MSPRAVSMQDVLGWRPRELSAGEWSEIESSRRVQDLNGKLVLRGLEGGWGSIRSSVLDELRSLLDVSLLEILARAWAKAHELEKYRDSERYPPEDTYEVTLVEHEISSTHEPRVEAWLEAVKIGEVHFTAKLALQLESIQLIIRNARIRRIEAGSCRAEGSLSCEGCELLERQSRKVRLPLEVDLGEGLEI